MGQSLCIERITHSGRGRNGGKFCRESRMRCRGYRAFFCISWDAVKFITATVVSMFFITDGE